jgi:hypothetical protein
MTYLRSGGITARRRYTLRCNASAGWPDWKPRWHLLAVPTGAPMGTARSVFNLAALGEKSESYVVRSTNPNHLVSERNVPDECVVPPDRRASVTVGPVERAGVVCAPMSQQRRGQRQHRDPGARAARSLCRHRSRTGAAPWPGCQPAERRAARCPRCVRPEQLPIWELRSRVCVPMTRMKSSAPRS